MGILLDADEAGSSRETHDHIVRLAPPLCISRDEVDAAADIIGDCVAERIFSIKKLLSLLR